MEKEPITSQGLEKLKNELIELKNIKRPKIITPNIKNGVIIIFIYIIEKKREV